jgi:predicted nucleic acid-binding Zn finger protein
MARKIALPYQVIYLANNQYSVISPQGREYSVNLSHDPATCDCSDYIYRAEKEERPCKHINLVRQMIEEGLIKAA